MNIYQTTIHARCPFAPVWDYYQATLETRKFVQVEEFEACCEKIRGVQMSQEDIGTELKRAIDANFPGLIFSLTVTGQHGTNCKTVVKR
jgi:hypothetical protein